jgi:predicted nuclease of restriction endonuclease-like (RecB) superfamily
MQASRRVQSDGRARHGVAPIVVVVWRSRALGRLHLDLETRLVAPARPGTVAMVKRKKTALTRSDAGYDTVLADVVQLIEGARHAAARSVNALMTATYWTIGRRIVEHEQHGAERAGYGEALIVKLSADLQGRFGRGFGRANLFQMRSFYLGYREILQTASGKLALSSSAKKVQTASGLSTEHDGLPAVAARFPLPWSHYVRLLAVRNPEGRRFYETEALRGGWTIRQLDRQIATQFYERTALSRNKAAMLHRGETRKSADEVTPEQEIKDPYVLEFLGLKDEYSETDLEAALIAKIESFLLELGGDFTFVGRQRRLRVGDAWYRIDLLFFHRRLRCLVIIDLKLDRFTHADAGQMHLYLNYAREHWMLEGENPPVGLVLCAEKDSAVARYALEGLSNKVLAAEYRTALPKERALVAEIERTIQQFEARRAVSKPRARRRRD